MRKLFLLQHNSSASFLSLYKDPDCAPSCEDLFLGVLDYADLPILLILKYLVLAVEDFENYGGKIGLCFRFF